MSVNSKNIFKKDVWSCVVLFWNYQSMSFTQPNCFELITQENDDYFELWNQIAEFVFRKNLWWQLNQYFLSLKPFELVALHILILVSNLLIQNRYTKLRCLFLKNNNTVVAALDLFKLAKYFDNKVIWNLLSYFMASYILNTESIVLIDDLASDTYF